MRAISGLLVALCAAITSCDDPVEPGGDLGPVPDVHFTTNATSYIAHRLPGMPARYSFTVITRFENRSAGTVFLGRCYPDSPQPLFSVSIDEPADEASGFGQIWACVGHNSQFELAPGATRIDTLTVEGPNSFDGHTHAPHGVVEGIFRMYFDVRHAQFDGAPAAPMPQRLSNAFRVRIE
jgi:hypothetical protein